MIIPQKKITAGKKIPFGSPQESDISNSISFLLCFNIKFINETDTNSYNYKDHYPMPGLGLHIYSFKKPYKI